MLAYSDNSNEPGTKTIVPRVDTAPHGVETTTWCWWSHTHKGRITSYPRIKDVYIYLQLRQTGDENGAPESIPPFMVWKPQLDIRRASGTRG